MRTNSARSTIRRGSIVAAIVLLILGLGTSTASAQIPGHHPPNLVVLGDSFAAGSGNPPSTSYPGCGRSDAAYGKLLDTYHAVHLEAFVACGGATTTDVVNNQVTSIAADTDVITVQALGNDFFFGALAALCVAGDCSRGHTLPNGETVDHLLQRIPTEGPEKLEALYDEIDTQMKAVHSHARVIVVDYGNPFPSPGGRVGPFCPYMTTDELGVAQDFANELNAALKVKAQDHGFVYLNSAGLFQRLDVCGFASAFFRLGESDAPFHPNQAGQGIYAAAVAARLYF